MSQGALFAFGCVIFFIVATGGFLFAMMSVRQTADRSREATGQLASLGGCGVRSRCSERLCRGLSRRGFPWRVSELATRFAYR